MKITKIILTILLLAGLASAQHTVVNLTWTNAANNISCPTPFTTNLYRALTSGGQSGTTAIKTGISGQAYSDTTTIDGTTVYYTVTNTCAWPSGAKEGGMSPELKDVIPPYTPAPGVPTGLSATHTTTGASLNWNAVPNVSGYQVYVSNAAKLTWHFQASTVKATFLDKTCKIGSICKYFVASTTATTVSDPSLVATTN